MLRRILLASALILTSATAFTSEAKAQTATTGTVEFNGTVGGACTFSNPVPGTLVIHSTDDSLLGSDSSSGNYPGGATADIDINCTADATLTVAAPTATGDALSGATFSATATSSNLGLDFDSAGTNNNNSIIAGQQDTINVNMLADNQGNAVPAGNYSYEVVITATP